MPQLTVVADQLLAPVPGGTGRYTAELLRAMAATAPEGWTPVAVVSRGDPERARVPGVAGPRVLPLPRRVLTRAWERGLPPGVRGDSVHATTPLAPPRRRRGQPLVVTVHDAVPWTAPETLTPRGAAWHRRAIARAAREADALVVPTRAVAGELARHVDIAAAVHVIGEGVAPSVVADDGDDRVIAGRLGLPPGYVLVVGTVEPRKDHAALVRAMSLPGAPDLPLLVAGSPGWGEVDLDRVRSDCGLSAERVRLLGAVTDRELAALLRGASVVAVPSRDEGFGLPVAEAMAVGTPVVHSDAPALVEVAGGAGHSFRRGDAAGLAEALRRATDPAVREELVAAGLRRARAHTWEQAARATWRVHLDLRERRSA